jgi:hypothetical protein
MAFRVYTLHDDCDAPRYVGSTARDLDLRLAWHVGLAKRTGSPVAVWIRVMLRRGVRPGIRLVATARHREEAAALEQAWLRHLEASGVALLNVRRRSCHVPTLAHRRAISDAMRGRFASFHTRLRMGAAQRRAARRRAAESTSAEF